MTHIHTDYTSAVSPTKHITDSFIHKAALLQLRVHMEADLGPKTTPDVESHTESDGADTADEVRQGRVLD